MGSTQLSYSVGNVSPFPGVQGAEGPGRETNFSALSTADKNEWKRASPLSIRRVGVTTLGRPKRH